MDDINGVSQVSYPPNIQETARESNLGENHADEQWHSENYFHFPSSFIPYQRSTWF